jgi:GTP cyclohydrolase IA
MTLEEYIYRMLEELGENPDRGGLKETPNRVAEAWRDWTAGYWRSPKDVLKTFEDGGEKYNEMVLVRRLPFYSHCEHHLAPFFGTADIAYIPNGKIVGLSKLDRLLDVYAKRLQVQERLTAQIVDALMEHLKPKGAACTIRARHLCMESRGIRKQGHETVTNALRGVFLDDHKARAEYLSMVK